MLQENPIDVKTVNKQNVVTSDQHIRLVCGKTRVYGLLIGGTRINILQIIIITSYGQGVIKLFWYLSMTSLTAGVDTFVQVNLQCGVGSSLPAQTGCLQEALRLSGTWSTI